MPNHEKIQQALEKVRSVLPAGFSARATDLGILIEGGDAELAELVLRGPKEIGMPIHVYCAPAQSSPGVDNAV